MTVDCETALDSLTTELMDLVDTYRADLVHMVTADEEYNDGYTEFMENIINDIKQAYFYTSISTFECETKYEFIVMDVKGLIKDYKSAYASWETGDDEYEVGYIDGLLDALSKAIRDLERIVK